MARDYLISITFDGDTVWLTGDGLETGSPCHTEVPGIADLYEAISGNTTPAAGGDPFTESPLDNGGNRPFEIHFVRGSVPTARFDELVALKDVAGPAGECTITIVGEVGSKTVTAVHHWNPVPISWGRFSSGRIRGLVLRYITTPA